MSSQLYSYKIFDLHTQKYILTNPQDPESILPEEVANSLLDFILPEEAKDKLSVATIEMGMTGEMIANNHPEPEVNVLLLAKGSRGIYGPPEYKALLAPYLDLVKDYPYQRYLSNQNVSALTKDLKVWVVDDEQGISGIEGIDNDIALQILGDSHGKMSLKLAEEMGSPENLMQYRMISADAANGWFAKGTIAPSLSKTLAKFDLNDHPELVDIDLIVPTSSLKGVSKQNLQPGVHQQQVHITHHDKSRETEFTLRSVVEKLEGDSFSSAVKQQTIEIEKLNQIFAYSETLNQEFMRSLQPKTMLNPDNPEERINFDPERWRECGDHRYITFRSDLEAGHEQLINSPIYAQDKQKFYASRARKAAQLSFVKAKGGMIFCSQDLYNNQICVPSLPNGAKVAAIRSPIIKLQDIALVENKLIDDINNDAGEPIKGAIICSPQTFEQMLFQTRSFIEEQTTKLSAADIDTTSIEALNPWNTTQYKDAVLSNIEGAEREVLTKKLNSWREAFNALIVNHQVKVPQLAQIRQDTFTAVIKGDFDGDNIAILSQQEYPAIYAGIESRINGADSYTAKLDKIKVTGEQELSSLLADKADPFILGKTANLAENLQSFAVAAERVMQSGSPEQQLDHIKQIAPSLYYMMANPTPEEIRAAEAGEILSTYRYYDISSTGDKLIDPDLIQKFDAYGLDKALLEVYGGGEVETVVRERIFETWKELLLNLTDAVAQQNQIAVDTFKSERPIDRDLVEGLSQRFKMLDDGLKKALKDNQTYLSTVPLVRDSLTNRSLLVQNVNNNLVAYESPVASYKQIQGLFPKVEDEFIIQEVASISNEYDKLTSLSATIRQKARIDNGPSMTFVDGEGRSFEVTNIMSQGHTVQSLREELISGESNIRIEPNEDPNISHNFFVSYSVRNGEWKSLGTLCNVCAEKLNLDSKANLELGNITEIDFVSSSAVYLADSYSNQAYRLAEEFRENIPDELVDDYAAATYNYLSNSTSETNRLRLMFQVFGKQLADRVEQMQLTDLKLDNLTGTSLNEQEIKITVQADNQLPQKNAVMEISESGELTKLGTISGSSYQLKPGVMATVKASYAPPSVADVVLPTGEEFTIGGMAKHIFSTAGTTFSNEELEMEVAPGEAVSTPILKVGDRVVGRLKAESVAYLEDNQLLQDGQPLNLSLTTIGKGYYQKIKAVAGNGKVLELVDLGVDYKQSLANQQVEAKIAFKSNRPLDQLFVYREGKRIAVGEFNRGSQGSHLKSLDRLKAMGLYQKPFRASINSRLSVLNLKVDPESVVYPEKTINQVESLTKIETTEENTNTNYYLNLQQQYQSFGVLRERDYLNRSGEVESLLSIDIVVDRELEQSILADSNVLIDGVEPFNKLNRISDGDVSIATETRKGFVVFSKPLETLAAAELNQLRQQLKLRDIYDLSNGDRLSQVNYQQQIQDNYPDLLKFEPNPLGSDNLYLPHVEDSERVNDLPSVISLELLEAINSQEILSEDQWQQNLKLSSLDLAWIRDKLELPKDNGSAEIIAQGFNGKNLSKLKFLASGFLSAEGELVYQHLQAGTNARFAAELKSTLGETSYSFHLANAQRLISKNIIPVVLHRDGEAKPVQKLLVNRPPVKIPFPEELNANQKSPITIGGQDKFGLTLNNPIDFQNPDFSHPITYEGIQYASVQHAYSDVVNRDGIPQQKTYGLVKDLMVSKLQQYPKIIDQIKANGGYKWLYSCSHILKGNDFWSGQGKDSPLIGVISSAMKQLQSEVPAKTSLSSKKVITLKSGKKKNLAQSQEREKKEQVGSRSLNNQDISKSIQYLGKLNSETQQAILDHLDSMKSKLNSDISQYAQGRQNFWLGTQWNLKDKVFESSGVWNSQLWELCKSVYPEADMALITYSGDEASAGIGEHRDDSYAAFEARSISIESIPGQETKWQMRQTYPAMKWVNQQNSDAAIASFSLPSGSMTAFNCKNPHAAQPGKGRWSINLWKISEKQKEAYSFHVNQSGLDGGAKDLGVDRLPIPLIDPIVLTPQSRALLSAPPIDNDQKSSISNQDFEIIGKPISMNFPLMTQGKPNLLPVSDCFEAMRGHGRTHTTRAFEPFKAYRFKEGNLAIAYKGDKLNPSGQIVLRIGKQYQVTEEMVANSEFQQRWSAREKHAPETLPKLFKDKIKQGQEIWGMTFEPLGDFVDGKVLDFKTGEEIYLDSNNQLKKPVNPLLKIEPKNDQVAYHMKKDLAMAEKASQFIGIPVSFNRQSSTKKYLDAWGNRANTGVYNSEDVVMVSGNGPWRGISDEAIQITFDNKYRPLLDQVIAAKAQIVVGSAKGTDLLVQKYLEDRGYRLFKTGLGYVQALNWERSQDNQNPNPEPQTRNYSLPRKPEPNQGVAMISIPNQSGAKQSILKEQILRTEKLSPEKANLFETVKVWTNQQGQITDTNSLIANYSDAPSQVELSYRAAVIGQETGQKAVIAFREDLNGTDALYSVNVPSHIDEYALRSKLEELNLVQYTIISTPKFNKIVISDRGGQILPTVETLAQEYDTKLKITQGTGTFIPEREYAITISKFEKENSAVSRPRVLDRSDKERRKSQPSNLSQGGNSTGLTSSLKPNSTLRKLISPKIESPAAIHQKLTLAAVPIIRDILNSSPGKRKFTDGEIVAMYDAQTKTLSLVDVATSALKMAAIYDGHQWQSDPKFIGGMKSEDIPFLKAALAVVKSNSKKEQVSEESQSYFAQIVETQATASPTYYSASVER